MTPPSDPTRDAPGAFPTGRARVALVIPTLDEADNLPGLLGDLPRDVRVVVVDNGSIDGSGDVARAHGAEVVREPARGYGRACLAGIRHLAEAPPEVLVILDADRADPIGGLPALTGPILAGEADLVVSARQAEPGALQPAQRFGNRFATLAIWGVTGRRFHDLGPFRAIRWAALERLAMADPTWGWNVEMQIKAVKRGLRIREVPLPYRRRHAGRSKISGTLRGSARAGVRIVQAVWRYRDG